ncbi:hypothetical protein Acr_18g0009730 [Actinidia rufa]|uniref:Uncharacterized protein n=1 Tax=Actinidia rufa TaxID=165716 RepID=A0A7J0G7N4_9ERIC|nr:hypothetical protein Acr_18g0009730 [Actinidia rufa]
MKKERDATVERVKKEVTKLKEKEAFAKKLAIEEYKSSDDFQEQIGRLRPDLDIQDLGIDLELAEEGEEDEVEKSEEKGEPNNSPSPQ